MVIFHSYAKITKRVVGKSSKPHLCRSNPHDVPSCSILYDSNRPQQSFFGTYLRSMESMVMINPGKKQFGMSLLYTVKKNGHGLYPRFFVTKRYQKYHLNLVAVSVLFLPALPTVSWWRLCPINYHGSEAQFVALWLPIQ